MLVIGSFGKDARKTTVAEPAVLTAVRAYWEGLRTDGCIPARDQIDPRGLASALEQVFLLERIAHGHGRFRLAGNLFHDLMGMDVRGMPFSAPFEPAARQKLQSLLEEVFNGAQGLHLSLEAERGIGRPSLSARLMLLPLMGRGDEPEMALGVLAQDGGIGRAPRRFHISTARLEALSPSETRDVILRKQDLGGSGNCAAPGAMTHGAGATRAAPLQSPLRLVHSRD